MLKWITVVAGVLFLILCWVSYSYGIALRNAGIIEGKMALKMAAQSYQENGYVTNFSNSYQVWLSTNVVSIGGTQY